MVPLVLTLEIAPRLDIPCKIASRIVLPHPSRFSSRPTTKPRVAHATFIRPRLSALFLSAHPRYQPCDMAFWLDDFVGIKLQQAFSWKKNKDNGVKNEDKHLSIDDDGSSLIIRDCTSVGQLRLVKVGKLLFTSHLSYFTFISFVSHFDSTLSVVPALSTPNPTLSLSIVTHGLLKSHQPMQLTTSGSTPGLHTYRWGYLHSGRDI